MGNLSKALMKNDMLDFNNMIKFFGINTRTGKVKVMHPLPVR